MPKESDFSINVKRKVQWKEAFREKRFEVDKSTELTEEEEYYTQQKWIRPHVYLPSEVENLLELIHGDKIVFLGLKNKKQVVIQRSLESEENLVSEDEITDKVFHIGFKIAECRNKLEEFCAKNHDIHVKISDKDRIEINKIKEKIKKADFQLEKMIKTVFRGQGDHKQILEMKLNEDVEEFSELLMLDVQKLVNDIDRHKKILKGLERAKTEKLIDNDEYTIFYKTFSEQLELLQMSVSQIKKLVNNLN